MESCQPKSTPINPTQILNNRPNEEPPDEEAKARYTTTVGSLIYLMVSTRPDNYCVYAGHIKSIHGLAAILPPSRSTAIASLYQSHTILSYYLPQ